MVGEGTLWGDVGVHIGIVVGGGGSLDHVIMLGFGDKAVGCDSAALGVILLVNRAVVGLGGIGSCLGVFGGWWGHCWMVERKWWVRGSAKARLHVQLLLA